ncbi:Aste57867_15625 [Aphanomyces stellatus]|uniref:Aste57867_15625 protein n=1 Tax=Aphanomyces stellatus TaxID=120398 RepID=A0A485L6I4_9STRA|nr:hypothetical protein As57867_015569 [Aphanomyces stellatus]VFT92422.1 Aste57867_15625 [Aphanomyces stellatus]
MSRLLLALQATTTIALFATVEATLHESLRRPHLQPSTRGLSSDAPPSASAFYYVLLAFGCFIVAVGAVLRATKGNSTAQEDEGDSDGMRLSVLSTTGNLSCYVQEPFESPVVVTVHTTTDKLPR